MANVKLGKVVHFYDKISVAVVKLEKALKVGDSVKLKKGEDEFEQKVESMQIDHKEVKSAKNGDEVAIKVDQAAKAGTEVYKP